MLCPMRSGVPLPELLRHGCSGMERRESAGLEMIHGCGVSLGWSQMRSRGRLAESVRPESKGGNVCVVQLTGYVRRDLALP